MTAVLERPNNAGIRQRADALRRAERADRPRRVRVTPAIQRAIDHARNVGVRGAEQAFQNTFLIEPHGTDQEARPELTIERDPMDGIGEDAPTSNPVPAVSMFYRCRNRALFRVTHVCPAYCAYCFRNRMVGDGPAWDKTDIDEGLDYIASQETVAEVVLSGGDPLVLPDAKLEYIFERIATIPHVRRIRIDTRSLFMTPERITTELASLLRRHSPLYVIAHFAHAYEVSPEVEDACARLADAGVPLRAHTPLLAGVNDDAEMLIELMETLLDARVQPYYLIQYIPTAGSERFRVPIERGIEFMRELERRCGGLAIPRYIVYLPDGGGKVVVQPDRLLRRTAEGWLFRTVDGEDRLYREDLRSGHATDS